jgi:hypothetical protein
MGAQPEHELSVAPVDDTTQIAMDSSFPVLKKKTTMEPNGSQSGPLWSEAKMQHHHQSTSSTMLLSPETAKQRIAGTIRKDLWHPRDDTAVVGTATRELAQFIVDGGHAHRSFVVQCGGVMALLRILEEYTSHEAVQYYALTAVEQLSLDVETRVAIREMDAIPLVVQSMRCHTGSARVQEAGRAALASICCPKL